MAAIEQNCYLPVADRYITVVREFSLRQAANGAATGAKKPSAGISIAPRITPNPSECV